MNNLQPTTQSTGLGSMLGTIGGNILAPGTGGAIGGQLGGILEGIIGGGVPDRMAENSAAMQKIREIEKALGFSLSQFAKSNGGTRTYSGKWQYKKIIEDLAMIFNMPFYGSMGGGVSSYMGYLQEMLPMLQQYAKSSSGSSGSSISSGSSSSQTSDPEPFVKSSFLDYAPLLGIALTAWLILKK